MLPHGLFIWKKNLTKENIEGMHLGHDKTWMFSGIKCYKLQAFDY